MPEVPRLRSPEFNYMTSSMTNRFMKFKRTVSSNTNEYICVHTETHNFVCGCFPPTCYTSPWLVRRFSTSGARVPSGFSNCNTLAEKPPRVPLSTPSGGNVGEFWSFLVWLNCHEHPHLDKALGGIKDVGQDKGCWHWESEKGPVLWGKQGVLCPHWSFLGPS